VSIIKKLQTTKPPLALVPPDEPVAPVPTPTDGQITDKDAHALAWEDEGTLTVAARRAEREIPARWYEYLFAGEPLTDITLLRSVVSAVCKAVRTIGGPIELAYGMLVRMKANSPSVHGTWALCREYFNAPSIKTSERTHRVDVSPGQEDVALQELHHISKTELPLFQRGGEIVRPVRLDQDITDAAGVTRRRGSMMVQRQSADALLSAWASRVKFEKHTKKGEAMPATPPVHVARMFLQGKERWAGSIRPLDCIAACPIWRPDGSVVTKDGYDAQTAIWLDLGGAIFPSVPENPTREDALRARDLLWEPFRLYPIPKPECRAVALAGLMTPVILATVDAVPIIGITARDAGFGKTLLARCIGVMAMGVEVATVNQPPSREEFDKTISSMLLAGDPVLVFDNCTDAVGGDTLNSIVTNPIYKARRLGESSTPSVSARVMVICNGNNLAFLGDTVRRTTLVVIEDDAVDQPDARDFPFHPVELVKARRPEMVTAALTILRAWHVAGRPKPQGWTAFGSFEGWEPIRQALMWLGEVDPVKSQTLVREDDPRREAEIALLELLHQATAGGEFKATDLQKKAHHGTNGPLNDLGRALVGTGDWSAAKVSAALRPLIGNRRGQYRLVLVRKDLSHGSRYKIERREG